MGHFSGLERCASVWACPVCAAVIRNVRAREIQAGADRWTEQGNSTLMLTFTLRHRLEDGLRESLDLLQRAYRRLTGLRAWRRLVQGLGYVGQIRALEMPWGQANGWHPHAHVLGFFEGQVSDEDLAAFEVAAFALWEGAVLAEGGRSLLAKHGLRVSRGAAAYIAKIQEHSPASDEASPASAAAPEWLAGSELARFDLKRGRHGSLLPFELLDGSGPRARALWVEYVEVTRGRRAIFWSKGLRDLLGAGDDPSDEDVIRQVEVSSLVYVLDAETYDGMRDDPSALVDALETAEQIADEQAEDDDQGEEVSPAAVGVPGLVLSAITARSPARRPDEHEKVRREPSERAARVLERWRVARE